MKPITLLGMPHQQQTATATTPTWWPGAVGYEIYIRSFADSDGDGMGDLNGITARLEYLAWLGVDVVWITPFYPSPGADHGYDVADYRGVDPQLGTLADFDALIGRAHELGLRVMIDIVPNHTSDRHEWFEQARSAPDAELRGYYHWHPPGPDGGPPNNWISHFGGPAWTLDPASGEYYLHLFLPEQPDLNWSDPRVRDEFDRILEFWFDRGVDGFRIDVAHALIKDAELRDNPVPDHGDELDDPLDEFMRREHPHDLDQPEVTEVYRRWREIAERHDAALVGEVYLTRPERISRYVRGDGLHGAFTFPVMKAPWDAPALRAALREHAEALGENAVWVLGSHDDGRPVTRFGRGDRGRRRALALTGFMSVLPGVQFLYQGEELGLDDPELAPEHVQDPVARASGDSGRDAARTPMPWAGGPGAGFTDPDATPWLPIGDRAPDESAVAQRERDDSFLARTRDLLAVRREVREAPPIIEWWPDAGDGTLVLERGSFLAALNTSDAPREIALPAGTWSLLFTSAEGTRVTPEGALLVAGEATALICGP